MNSRLCELVGYSAEELASMRFQDITHPDDLETDVKLMYSLLAGKIGFYTLEKRYLHRSGAIIWISLSVSLVRDAAGMPAYFISVVKDINDRKRAETELRRSKESLELAIEATGLGMFDSDPQADRHDWNDEIKRHFGLSSDAVITYERFLRGVHADDRDRINTLILTTLEAASGGHFQTEYRTVGLDDGKERWIEARGKVYFDSAGKPVRFIGTTVDITERKCSEDALHLRERQLQLMFEANPIGTVRGTPTGVVTEANSAYLRIIGRSRDEMAQGQIRWDEITFPEHLARDRRAIEQALQQGVSDVYEKEYLRPDGRRVPVLVACAALGAADELVAFVLDLSERKQAEEKLLHTALHDPLTGLPNRGLLFDYARHVFGRVRRNHRHSAILFVDLDRFKPINDNHGHEVGDEVLKEVARRLEACTRADDIVFRLGGDEFLVLLPEIEEDDNAGDVARHLAECLGRIYRVEGLELTLSASIGISIYPRDGEDIDTLINNADAAMYHAKQEGRNTTQFYSQELAARSQLQLKIESQLRTALTRNAFQLYYQPLIDMQTLEVLGVEALIRWDEEAIGPDLFVPVAEATGQIGRLSDWVIAEACMQHKTWREHGLPPIPIAVNISAVQLRQQDFAVQIAAALRALLVDVSALQVEVTETALMENLDRAIGVLAQLKALGIKIALDDFGTGYSSLNYLSRLPLDKIKVDKSFIQRIEEDPTSRAITEAVIALGRTLELDVVAEGIESGSTLRYLREHGCNQAQGYHVCRPVSAADFETWYQSYEPSRLH